MSLITNQYISYYPQQVAQINPNIQIMRVFETALRQGDFEKAQSLLDKGVVQVQMKNEFREPLLFLVARLGNKQLFELALEKAQYKADILLQRNSLQETVLHAAMTNCQVETIEAVMQASHTFHVTDCFHQTPLVSALRQSFELFKKVLGFAIKNKRGVVGEDLYFIYLSLTKAQQEELDGACEIKDHLLQNWFPTLSQPEQFGIFMQTLAQNHLAMATELLDRFDLVIQDTPEEMGLALFKAVNLNALDVLERLVLKTSHLEWAENGGSLLMFACSLGHEKIAHLLLDRGANPHWHSELCGNAFFQAFYKRLMSVCERIYDAAKKQQLPIEASKCSIIYGQLDPQAREDLCRFAPFDRFIKIVTVAHIWGLKGSFVYKHLLGRYEGAEYGLVGPSILRYARNFLAQESLDPALQKATAAIESFKVTFLQQAEESFDAFQKGKWVGVPIRIKEHISYLAIWKDTLYFCDRSFLTRGDATRCQMGRCDQQSWNQVVENIKAYRNQEALPIDGILEPFQLSVLEKIPHKTQKVGNCVVAGLKAAIHCIFYETLLEAGKPAKEAATLARSVYKQFTTWMREQTLLIDFLPQETLQAIQEKVTHSSRFSEVQKEHIQKQISERLA